MAEALGKKPPFRVSVRNFMTNRLMCRKQFNVEIEHPGRATVSKKDLQKRIARMYKVQEDNTVILYGFRTKFGGAHSKGHGFIYDNLAVCKRYEPKYRLVRVCPFTFRPHLSYAFSSSVCGRKRRVHVSSGGRRRTGQRSIAAQRKQQELLPLRRSSWFLTLQEDFPPIVLQLFALFFHIIVSGLWYGIAPNDEKNLSIFLAFIFPTLLLQNPPQLQLPFSQIKKLYNIVKFLHPPEKTHNKI